MKIGVLALQGDFDRHARRLSALGAAPLLVKKPADLKPCDGLILPGGESTTLVKLLHKIDLFNEIPRFANRRMVFGTCAGAILLSRTVENHPVETLNLLDVHIARNAYGSQIDSFIDEVDVHLGEAVRKIEGVFIRAPKFRAIGSGVTVLGHHKDDVVMVRSGNILAATFHPELSDDPLVHQYFLDEIARHQRQQ